MPKLAELWSAIQRLFSELVFGHDCCSILQRLHHGRRVHDRDSFLGTPVLMTEWGVVRLNPELCEIACLNLLFF